MTIVPVETLRALVVAKKQRLGLSYRQIVKEAGLPHFSLVQGMVKRGRRPDADAHVKLQKWVGVDLGDEKRESDLSSMEAVLVFTERDPSLSSSAAKALQDLMQIAYDELKNKSENNA